MKRSLLAAVSAFVAMKIAAHAVPLPERLASPPSTVVEFADGTFAHVFLSPDEKWRIAVDRDEVDEAYLDALVSLEDERFFLHPGVDPIAIARAAITNLARGKCVSGASTITMQLVRVLEPRPRTVRSKVVESLRAMQLELVLSKEEILETYLQFVPYGKNLEGVEAASLAYFGHRSTALSGAEIATLLAVPQNPTKRFPSEANAARLAAARDGIARRLAASGKLPLGTERVDPEEALAQVVSSRVPAGMTRFPRYAPHAAIWLRDRNPGVARIRSTLDRGVQLVTEARLRAAQADLARRGILNGSAVVVRHDTGDVAALVGNLDFFDENGGQIVGFAEPRSPGSTLKPFLYAIAIEQGVAGPDHLVTDIPTSYGGYTPKNFDGTFDGLVTLENALSRSLNVPFVSLLQQTGVEPFLGSLRTMGVASLVDEPGFYGLSAIVGGVELTPLEVAGLYATLAEDGRHRPLRVMRDEEPEPPVDVFSPGAAYLTKRALAIKDRPDFPSRRQLTGAPRHIHWKTGTSFGHRDAWAAGSGPTFTAVIWLGNFDNAASVELVGSEAAGPLLFDVLEAVASRSGPPAGDRVPKDLMRVEVCAYSGHVATPACPERSVTLARRSAVPTATCPYHVAVDVDLATGQALTPSCRGGREYATRTFVVWPSTVRRWLKDQHRRLPEPPVFAEGCARGGVRRAPLILSPAAGHVALLLGGVALESQEIPLEAESHAPDASLSWFVDGEFVGTVRADERLWWKPKPGVHQVLVSDESGLSSSRRLEVRNRMH